MEPKPPGKTSGRGSWIHQEIRENDGGLGLDDEDHEDDALLCFATGHDMGLLACLLHLETAFQLLQLKRKRSHKRRQSQSVLVGQSVSQAVSQSMEPASSSSN